MEEKDIESLKERFLQEIEEERGGPEKRRICKKYLEEELSSVFCSLKKLPAEKKKLVGKRANELRELILEKTTEFREEQEVRKEWIDITLPGKKPVLGNLHPLTQLQKRCEEIFREMGFSVIEGPEAESEWYNFDALNFKEDHPVREMQETLFLKQKNREHLASGERLLMRTHTSCVQIRYMEKNKPPFRIIVPGRVFRNEATDNAHEINFYQLEGLMVAEDISVANFKAVIKSFFQKLFGSHTHIRLRPSFFPFTEPSFEVDMSCSICDGKGCSVCKQTGWIEVLGAGMVHPNVLENGGVDSGKYKGFAFGGGVDRLAQIKYKIDDVRLFYGGDLRFLKQF